MYQPPTSTVAEDSQNETVSAKYRPGFGGMLVIFLVCGIMIVTVQYVLTIGMEMGESPFVVILQHPTLVVAYWTGIMLVTTPFFVLCTAAWWYVLLVKVTVNGLELPFRWPLRRVFPWSWVMAWEYDRAGFVRLVRIKVKGKLFPIWASEKVVYNTFFRQHCMGYLRNKLRVSPEMNRRTLCGMAQSFMGSLCKTSSRVVLLGRDF